MNHNFRSPSDASITEFPVSNKNFNSTHLLRVWRRFWYIIVSGGILGLVGAIIFQCTVPPLYKTDLRFFIWGKAMADTVRQIQKTPQGVNDPEVIATYNNLISQSMMISKALANNYKGLLEDPAVAKRVKKDLIALQWEKPKYRINVTSNIQGSIVTVEGIAADPALAQAAVNTTMKVFQEEQERLMGVRLAQLIQEADIPRTAFFPKWKTTIPTGILIGLALGIALALLIDFIDLSIKTPEDVDAQNILFLGNISQCKNVSDELNLADKEKDRTQRVLFDELSLIKTNMRQHNIENPQQTICVVSNHPGAGKSTFAILLAQILADSHNKALLIDCDLRKPSLCRKLKQLPAQGGLVDCLLAYETEKNPAKYIVASAYDNVDFLSHGQMPRRPTDLLESRRFDDLLEELKKTYRYIIIDTPPAYGMADAVLIAQKADGVIFVAHHGKTRIDHFHRLLTSWAPLQRKFLGVVINRKKNPFSSGPSYYGYDDNKRGKS